MGGDSTEEFSFEGMDYGYSVVYTDGRNDGDYTYHDAEVRLFVGWNIV